MHRQTWIALVCCFAAAMGILLLMPEDTAHSQPPVTETTTTSTTTTTVAVTRGSALPEKAAAYVGNIRSHKFHRLSCRYASCPNCRAKFATRQEAIEAGFSPCGTCDP